MSFLHNHILANVSKCWDLGLSDILGLGEVLVLDILDLIEVPGRGVVRVGCSIEGIVHAVRFLIFEVLKIAISRKL